MDKIAILIPCYNEAKTIAKVINDFKNALPGAVIYVYDNNSDDDTAVIANSCGAIVRIERQQGKGNVIRRMFREIDAECYILTDGDDTYPAENAPEIAKKILEEQVDMVVGDRLSSTYYTENKRKFHNFGNSLVKKSINLLFKSNIQDIMTGYRGFSYEFVKTFPVLSRGFEIETEMTIHAIDKGLAIDNVVVNYRDRPEGSVSKINTYSDGMKVLFTIFQLYRLYKPFHFFLILALLFLLLSIILFIPLLFTYFETGLVPRFPTLFIAVFLALASLQSLFCGLILENSVQRNKQRFELDLYKVYQKKNS